MISYGIASKPIVGASQDGAWKAMLYAMRKPAECGLKVDNMAVCDQDGFMLRTMRLAGKPGSPTVTDNIRVTKVHRRSHTAQSSTTPRTSKSVSLPCERTPLRFEMYRRNSKDRCA